MKASHLYFFGFFTMAIPTLAYLYFNGGMSRYASEFDFSNVVMIVLSSIGWTLFIRFLDSRYVVSRKK